MASAVGMDRAGMKLLFGARGFPIVEHVVVGRRTGEAEPAGAAEQAERVCGYPCLVKPANLGSTAGIIPGFTATSLHAKLWAATGVPSAAVIDRLIALALERHRDRVGPPA